ncbi:MAG TPA: hypothetical protein VFA88_08895 [Gaiellaceae bacterium]|nr:hypothetical protein [Gaiellaceae bacterium]
MEVGEVRLRGRHGGDGPAVVMLHAQPRTNATCIAVAPLLAEPGGSSAALRNVGQGRFAVGGHDGGTLRAHRAAAGEADDVHAGERGVHDVLAVACAARARRGPCNDRSAAAVAATAPEERHAEWRRLA